MTTMTTPRREMMVTQAQISHDFYQHVKENAAKRKHKADYFKPFWKTKKGHWKLIYPDIDDIEGSNCMLTVQCLDCGAVIQRDARRWLVDRNQRGCRNCRDYSRVVENAKAIEARGFKVLSTDKFKRNHRVYTIKCQKCGMAFEQLDCNLRRWIKNGAKCPGCLNKDLPLNAIRIRKARTEAGLTYSELGEKVGYSGSRVKSIANNISYSEEVAEFIADAAERIAKEKQ